MPRHHAQHPLDPAADAALLLRRIAFGTLALLLPIASLVSRRAAVVLAPIGVVLLVIAMLIEDPRDFVSRLKRSVFSLPGLILIGLVAWAVLSLVWSPYTLSATEKASNIVLAVALGFLGNAALPERMRASNLNLAPLGAGTAAAFALATGAVAIRTAGVQFIMITLAFGQMAYSFVFQSPLFGGDDGLSGAPRPDKGQLEYRKFRQARRRVRRPFAPDGQRLYCRDAGRSRQR